MNETQQAIEFTKSLRKAFTDQIHKANVTIKLHHQDCIHLITIMKALKKLEPTPLTGGYGHDQY